MTKPDPAKPDNTAVRTALWRALHLLADDSPYIFEDKLALHLANPESNWRSRQDMSPFTKPFRASILTRARYVEECVKEAITRGVSQYVILGAGLDSFVFRNPELANQLRVFEIDQPSSQAWKIARLEELGLTVPANLKFVAHDFETNSPWIESLKASGFNPANPTVVASTGVSMYLTREANLSTFRQAASLAPGSSFISSFMVPFSMVDPEIRFGVERAAAGAKANGTPWLSHFTPDEMAELAREAGFSNTRHISSGFLAEEYFKDRSDGLRPPQCGEELILAVR